MALRRVNAGGTARVGDHWFDHGRRVPGYLADALTKLCDNRLVAVAVLDAWGMRRAALTARRDRPLSAAVRHRQSAHPLPVAGSAQAVTWLADHPHARNVVQSVWDALAEPCFVHGLWAMDNRRRERRGARVGGVVMVVGRGGWVTRPRSIAASPALGMRIRPGWIVRSDCAGRWLSGWGSWWCRSVFLWTTIARRGSEIGIVRGGMGCWRQSERAGCGI